MRGGGGGVLGEKEEEGGGLVSLLKARAGAWQRSSDVFVVIVLANLTQTLPL